MTQFPSRNMGSRSMLRQLSPFSARTPQQRMQPAYPAKPMPASAPAPQQKSENAQLGSNTQIPPTPPPQQQYTPPPLAVPGQESPILVNQNMPPQQTTPPPTTTPAPDGGPPVVEDLPAQESGGVGLANPWDSWTPQQNINAATISRWQYALQNPAAMPAFYKSLGVMFADQPGIDWSQVATPAMTNIIQRMAAGIGGGYNELRQFLQNQVNNLLANGGQQQPAPQPAPAQQQQSVFDQPASWGGMFTPNTPPETATPLAPRPGQTPPAGRYTVRAPGTSKAGNGVYTGR